MARLSNLGRGSYVSDAALANVLDRVKSNLSVLDEGSSRWSVKRRGASDVRVETFFGPLMQTMPLALESGNTMDACFVYPVALLEHLARVLMVLATAERHHGQVSR